MLWKLRKAQFLAFVLIGGRRCCRKLYVVFTSGSLDFLTNHARRVHKGEESDSVRK